jgi:hypothetical protein
MPKRQVTAAGEAADHFTVSLGSLSHARRATALEEQRNGEWRYLEFLQVTSLITAEIFMREIPGGTRARHRSRPVDLPEHRY